jgi:hypothetical protein
MTKHVTFPRFMENRFTDEKGNFTEKFQAILFLMRITGIAHLESMIDVFNLMLRIKIGTTIIEKTTKAEITPDGCIVQVHVGDQVINITLQDLIDHQCAEIQGFKYLSINEYIEEPLGYWISEIMAGNNSDWNQVYSSRISIDIHGELGFAAPVLIRKSGREIYIECRNWVIRKMAVC